LFAKGQWRKGWQALRAYSKNFNISFPRSIKSQLLRPLLKPTILRCRNFLHQENNLLYACPQPDFIKRMGLKNKSVILEGIDPLTERDLTIRQTGIIAGFFWPSIQAFHELEVRDPSADVHLVEYCMGVPDDQFFSSEGRRMLIRRAMNGLLPDCVRLNTLHGKQAADGLFRVVDQKSNIDYVLNHMETAAEVRKYVDVDAAKNLWQTVLSGNASSKNIGAFLRSISFANLVFPASSS